MRGGDGEASIAVIPDLLNIPLETALPICTIWGLLQEETVRSLPRQAAP